MIYKSFIRPLLFRLEAEKAHEAVIKLGMAASDSALLKRIAGALYNFQSPRLSQRFWGLEFRNPIGLAAGFDKNGRITGIMEAVGFGYTEVGSITAEPSAGNPRPRSFRLPKDRSLINRMGLNNEGARAVVNRLADHKPGIPLGINIAKTHHPDIMGDKAIEDYLSSYREACRAADYITVNISCPNTREGKTFEEPGALDELLSAFKLERETGHPPTLVKFSVDLTRPALETLLEVCERHRVDGYVATNTSIKREGLSTPVEALEKIGPGGLSGEAIAARSTEIVRWISEITEGRKPIIGVGGIHDVQSALEKLQAGADLLQLYTGLIYEGPGLVKRINRTLLRHLERNGLERLDQLQRTPVNT